MEDAVHFFKAIADKTRLEMLWLLANKGELCVCDLMEVLGITQSKASRHLHTLFTAGLVRPRRQGLWVYYSLRKPADPLTASQLSALRTALSDKKSARALLTRLEKWLEHKQSGALCR